MDKQQKIKKKVDKKQIILLLPMELLPFLKLSKHKNKKAGWLDNPLLMGLFDPHMRKLFLNAFVVEHN
jgi:hypothetical protein